jgi:hypothetical protein
MASVVITTTQADTDIAAILAIVEPSLYVEVYGQRYVSALGPSMGPYEFDTYVKAWDGLGKLGTPGRTIRAALLDRAEAALEALEVAGWHLTEYPRMEFTGIVKRFTQTFTGEVVQPSQQGEIALKMRFAVDSPKP